MKSSTIVPFDNSPALDGYHCQTNALAKIFHYHNYPLSEDLLLGLGAGMGFIYWKMNFGKEVYVFIGGRGNNKNFFVDIGRRTGVNIKSISTSSVKKAEQGLLQKVNQHQPVMLFGDMGYLPWFKFPEEYHFGGHTFVICGYDGKETFLASDLESQSAGLKKGFYHQITSEQLNKARNSPHKPFPPKNTSLDFDFTGFHPPTKENIYSAIKQNVSELLEPPIKNLGVKGIRHTAKEILLWPKIFDQNELIMNLFNLYIFIEIGGTGGGCFRHMYARFLQEASEITGNKNLLNIAGKFWKSGELFTEISLLFKDYQKTEGLNERISYTSEVLKNIAGIEENALIELSKECS